MCVEPFYEDRVSYFNKNIMSAVLVANLINNFGIFR